MPLYRGPDIVQHLNVNFTTTLATGVATNLAFAVSAGDVWNIDFSAMVQCSSTGGIRLGINTPAGSTLNGEVYGNSTGATVWLMVPMTAINAIYGNFSTVASQQLGAFMKAVVTAGAAGTVTITACAVTATQTATLFAGARLIARKSIAV